MRKAAQMHKEGKQCIKQGQLLLVMKILGTWLDLFIFQIFSSEPRALISELSFANHFHIYFFPSRATKSLLSKVK